MSTNQFQQQFSKMNINNLAPQQFSSDLSQKKMGPVVPPKPYKQTQSSNGVHTYENVDRLTNYSGKKQDEDYLPPPPPPLNPETDNAFINQPLSHDLPPPPPHIHQSQPQSTGSTPKEHQQLSESPTSSTVYASASNYAFPQAMSASSLYDSSGTPIYEPIQSRPPSQMSNRSNYSSSTSSIYYPYLSTKPSNSSNLRTQMPSHSQPATRSSREAEVDHLTDLLVQSMDASADPEFFEGEPPVVGMCSKCGQKVLGEGSGCTAMNQVYHISCFTCSICHCRLQGKPFYAVNAKPYCEEDYLNTLEKCSVCTKPILDRILRATGKPYHPTCFTCVVCGKSLDGVPFTVDATNQIHCIDDFHKKFAPRCCVCLKPIMPEPGQEETVRVVALDRSFHIQCYCCEDCGMLLSSEAEGRGCYPLDEHILCKQCNANRVQTLTSTMSSEL